VAQALASGSDKLDGCLLRASQAKGYFDSGNFSMGPDFKDANYASLPWNKNATFWKLLPKSRSDTY